MKQAVLFISHGSRALETRQEVEVMVRRLKRKSGIAIFQEAYLEVHGPSIPEGIVNCIRKGATRIVLLLNFLNAGRHILKDIPAIVAVAKKKYPEVKFIITPHLSVNPELETLFLKTINEAIP